MYHDPKIGDRDPDDMDDDSDSSDDSEMEDLRIQVQTARNKRCSRSFILGIILFVVFAVALIAVYEFMSSSATTKKTSASSSQDGAGPNYRPNTTTPSQIPTPSPTSTQILPTLQPIQPSLQPSPSPTATFPPTRSVITPNPTSSQIITSSPTSSPVESDDSNDSSEQSTTSIPNFMTSTSSTSATSATSATTSFSNSSDSNSHDLITSTANILDANVSNTIENNNNNNNSVTTFTTSLTNETTSVASDKQTCHYADSIYPIDSTCGADVCFANGLDRTFSLRYAWDATSLKYRNDTGIDILRYMQINGSDSFQDGLPVYPTELEVLNKSLSSNSNLTFDSVSINLVEIHMSIEYFCCIEESVYTQIIESFANYSWDPFDLYFGEFTCLNMTESDQTIDVLLLDDNSQELMKSWTDDFESYVIGLDIDLSEAPPRSEGQPFHSTVAVFDEYNQELESVSVDMINYLNNKYKDVWNQLPFTFSKDNVVIR